MQNKKQKKEEKDFSVSSLLPGLLASHRVCLQAIFRSVRAAKASASAQLFPFPVSLGFLVLASASHWSN